MLYVRSQVPNTLAKNAPPSLPPLRRWIRKHRSLALPNHVTLENRWKPAALPERLVVLVDSEDPRPSPRSERRERWLMLHSSSPVKDSLTPKYLIMGDVPAGETGGGGRGNHDLACRSRTIIDLACPQKPRRNQVLAGPGLPLSAGPGSRGGGGDGGISRYKVTLTVRGKMRIKTVNRS